MANTNVQDAVPDATAGIIHEKGGSTTTDSLYPVGEEARPLDDQTARRVLRKIDWFMIPAMIIGYGLVYWDKAILGSAAILGMMSALQLKVTDPLTGATSTERLSWATSLFYFGQLAGSYPMAYIVQRFKARQVMAPAVIIWAIICAATAGVKDHRGLYVQRFFLGFFESIIPTSFVVIVSGFYTQSEQALRQTLWWSATGWFTILGGAMNYGFANITSGTLAPWQYVYISAGILTFLFGIWCFFIPNSPADAWFLTPDERIVAVERLRAGQTGVKNPGIKLAQIKEGVVDYKIWLVALAMAAAYTVNGATTGFGPLIVSTFGYSTLESILLQFPLGAVSGTGIVVTGWLCSKYGNIRVPLLVLCCLPVIAGFAMIWKSTWEHHAVVPVVGYTLAGFFGPVVGLVITLGAGNIAGSTKKSFSAAALFVAYCVGNIIGPHMIVSETVDQHYPGLWTALIVLYIVVALSTSALAVLLYKENKRRDALNLDEGERDRHAFKDLTDRENLHFRYVY